ncbi:MAG: enoyl-CoA hydratase [Desulfobacterales bacterium]|nr:enoyl-CoA hydratase [Desulfobacterales bacterium]
MQFQDIVYKKEDSVVRITMNRPDRRNALSIDMGKEIKSALEKASQDNEVRAVVITGAGSAFCSGIDLPQGEKIVDLTPVEIREEIYAVFQGVIRAIVELPKPVIASVNGPAIGAGFDLCLACDIRIAAEDAKFSEFFVRIGTLPGMGGMFFLPQLVGIGKANELAFTGDIIDGVEAERIGLVNKVVPSDQLEKATGEFANKLARGATKAIGMIKMGIRRGIGSNLSSELEFASFAQSVCIKTDDAREGFKAALEKIKPEFKGR